MTDTTAPPSTAEQDPLAWCIGITLAFAALVWWRLGIPSKIYFDEVHYVGAARRLLQLIPANAEHPLVGKEAIAGAIALWGDSPMVWRIPSALMGCIGLYAFTRAIWFASGRAFATQAASVLLFTDFSWFVQSRIAMLDMVMAGFGMIGLWQVAAAVRQSNSCAFGGGERLGLIRARLALAGISFGLAMGAKWSVLPAVALVGMGFIALRVRAAGRASLAATNAPPLPGISLAEGMFWLGSVPLALSGSLIFTFLGFTTLNIYSQIGLITLMGLIAKNGILIVEFANSLQEQGRNKLQAIIEGAATRLRPILMTTTATVVGHLPLVFAKGPGAGCRNSIGIVLITGMIIGTLFTLFVVPSIYMLLAKDRHGKSVEAVDEDAQPEAVLAEA